MGYELQTWIQAAASVGAGVAMGFGAIGAGIGEGHTAARANAAMSRNPGVAGEIFKTMLVGQAIAESASIFALVVAMILLFTQFAAESVVTVCVLLAAGISMGLGAIGSGVGSGFPAGAACTGIARQPGASERLTTNMLIGSAICQTPSIFALVTSLIMLYSNFSQHPISPTWAAVLGAGFSSGLGAIGSGIGEGLVAESGCEGIARKPSAATPVTNTMLLGMAVTETTAIYSLLISMILLFKTFPATSSLASAAALLGAGVCMGFGAIGPGVGEGFTARNAVSWIARNEKATAELTRVMLVGQAVAESTGIYSLVVALVMIFVM